MLKKLLVIRHNSGAGLRAGPYTTSSVSCAVVGVITNNFLILYPRMPNLQQFKSASQKKKEENKAFYSRLKRTKPKNLDDTFHQMHEEVFSYTDCLECANCCKTTSPIFKDRDIERIAKAFRIKPSDFITQYLKVDADGDYVLTSSPCPFLDAENYCTIYKDRPTACREYPHTDRKRMVQILDLTYNNTLVCPAVLDITEKLKNVF